jgi:lysophospholipase L1-like esterase
MNLKEKKSALLTLLLLAVVFAGIDLLLGFILIPESYSNFRVQNKVYHHGLKKKVSTEAAWGPLIYNFYTNNLAFRDEAVKDIPLQSNNKRILIMGDSHSEGVGVEYPYTFAGRLQKMASKKGIEILNASAVSYSPKIHYLKGNYLLNEKGLQVDEIWVTIDISDLQNEIAYQSFQPIQNKRKLYPAFNVNTILQNHSFTFYAVGAFRRNKDTESMNNTLLALKNQTGSLPDKNAISLYKEFFRSFDNNELLRNPDFHGVSEWIYRDQLRELADEGLQLGFENIRKLNLICIEKNINLQLSVHPWQSQVFKADTTDYYVESWRKFCKAENIEFVNLYPVFVTAENPLFVAKTCYIEGDNHWNETGHERVAQHLEKYIE